MDLLARTAELVDIASESFQEAEIADHVERTLRAVPGLDVHRIGDNVVARTGLDRAHRLVLAGHTDTVPANDNTSARIEGDTLWGLGSTDMKSGLAVMLALAEAVPEPAIDVTYVFYVAEEVAAEHNGLKALFETHAELLAGDAAVLGEPTDGQIEAGCQGTMRIRVTLTGERAHTARPWMGRNAIHRAGEALRLVAAFDERRPVIDGCEYREALQAVAIEGGVAGNVVPDRVVVGLNRRFAPDRSPEDAEAETRAMLAPALDSGDTVEVVDVAPAAAPNLEHPLLRTLIDRGGIPIRAKLGWTDVARFAAHGMPACNLGPGDPTLAHTKEERVDRGPIEATYAALSDLLTSPP